MIILLNLLMNMPAVDAIGMEILLNSTLLLLLTAAANWIFRRMSSATKHLLWSAVIGALLLLPFLTLWLPHREVSAPSPAVPAAFAPKPSVYAAPLPLDPNQVILYGRPRELKNPPARPVGWFWWTPGLEWTIVRVVALPAGVLLVLGQLIAGLRRIEKIRKTSRPLDERTRLIADESLRALRPPALSGEREVAHTPSGKEASGRIGLRHPIELAVATDGSLAVPVTWGVRHAVVLLPAQSIEWSDDCLKAALLHEYAHILRRDWLTQTIARIVCALYWWHPLVWLANRAMREASERACDDTVLRAGMPATDYAERLVDVVRSMPASRSVAIALAQSSEVGDRVVAILDKKRDRRTLTLSRIFGTAAILGALTCALSVVRVVAYVKHYDPLPARGIMEMVYLKDAGYQYSSQAMPPHTLDINVVNTAGHEQYSFSDPRTGVTFHDGAFIKSELDAVLLQGVAARPGATRFRIPTALSALTNVQVAYVTDDQRQAFEEYTAEYANWKTLLADSPVICTDADILPNAEAVETKQMQPIGRSMMPERQVTFFCLKLTMTPGGAKRLFAFTSAHHGSILAVLVDGGVFSAPVIQSDIRDQSEISGLASLADAQNLARRLNTPPATAPNHA